MARQSTPVLVTRPQAEGEAFAAALTNRFGERVRPIVSPLMVPGVLTPEIPSHTYAAVIFTSAQAVHAARQLGLRLPPLAWCVGRKTAQVATAAGFQARSADGDAEALLRAIKDDPPKGRILYLRGVDTVGNLLENLQYSGHDVDVAIVYAQEPVPLSPDAIALLQSPIDVIVPLFSPRSSALFRAALPPDHHARLHIAAISAAAADPVRDLPGPLAIARTPDGPAMLEAVETLLAALPSP